VRRRRYSLVSLAWWAGGKTLLVGTTHVERDILIAFDPATGAFRSCGYAASGIADPLDHKIHRGLWVDEKQASVYFGTTTLADVPETILSPGGSLIRYDLRAGTFHRLSQQTPGEFYQGTVYDDKRQFLYCFGIPGLGFGVFDLAHNRLVRYHCVESIPHISAIDDDGGVWGTWGFSRQAFFRYHPDTDRFEFPVGCKFPNARAASNVMFSGAGPVDSMVNGGDGFLYVASALGEVFRLDPRSAALTYLGKPFIGNRLPGMCLGDDGAIYLCGGTDTDPALARYHRDTNAFEMLGPVRSEDGTSCFRCHDLLMVGRTAYVAETDNQTRSGYLWVCEV
jgi:sugar lactone lactonase YvrE